MSSRMPHRFHGTARPFLEPALIQRAVFSSDSGVDTFEPPSKHAPITDFIVAKPSKRSKTKKPSAIEASSSKVAPEESESAFSNKVEIKEEVQLRLIERCSTSTEAPEICNICEEEIRNGLKRPNFISVPLLPRLRARLLFRLLATARAAIDQGGKGGGRVYGMQPNCLKNLTPDASRSLLTADSAEVYRRFVEVSSISRRELRCPECGQTVGNTDARSVECPCGTVLCSTCSSIEHRPVACSVYGEYIAERDGKDSNPAEPWYPQVKHLCRCPKCGEYAENEGRCNYITCICGDTYCRICSTPYSYNHTQHCVFKTFTVSLIDVPVHTPAAPVTPALINRTLTARNSIDKRRKEIARRLSVLDKNETTEVVKDIAELTRLLELAVLSAEWNDKSRRVEDALRMAFFAFVNTSDGNVSSLRTKCGQLHQRIAEIRKSM